MTDREETQDAPVMDGATDAAPEEKKQGEQEQRAADATVQDDGQDDHAHGRDVAADDVEDDLRSIRAYGEDR